MAGETVEKMAGETVKITEALITGKQWLGDIRPMSQAEYARELEEDEKRKREGMKNLRPKGRDVEEEMAAVSREKAEEKKREEEMLLKIKQQREAEEAERAAMMAQPRNESANPAKQHKARGSDFMSPKKKKGTPDAQQMSQTSEFKWKID